MVKIHNTESATPSHTKKESPKRFLALPDLVTSVLGVRNAQHFLDVASFVTPNPSHSRNGGEFLVFFFSVMLNFSFICQCVGSL